MLSASEGGEGERENSVSGDEGTLESGDDRVESSWSVAMVSGRCGRAA